MLYGRIFPRWKPDERLRPRGSQADLRDAAVAIQWMGTAGHILTTASTTVLLDPYLSRPNLIRVAATRLVTDEAKVLASLPPRVDAILCGHSHFDHLLDAPFIAKTTGAKIVGSHTTCSFARAAGVPEAQIVIVPREGAEVRIGDIEVRFVRSRHGRIFPLGIPYPGEVLAPPSLPAHMSQYRMGGAFGVLVRTNGVTIYHNGSADLVDTELDGERADVLLVGLAGRQSTRNYLGRLVDALTPKLIVPTHHDSFFGPLDRGVHLLPRIDMEGFSSEVHAVARDATLITPGYFERIAVPPGDARGAVLVT